MNVIKWSLLIMCIATTQTDTADVKYFGEKCTTFVDHVRGSISSLKEAFIAGRSNDWSVIEQTPDAGDPNNPSDCYPETLPFITKRCFNNSCNNGWFKVFNMQVYNFGTSSATTDQFAKINAVEFGTRKYFFAQTNYPSENQISAMIYVLIEKKSDTPSDTGHYLMMMGRNEGNIIYTLPFNFPTDDYYRLHPFNRIPFAAVQDYSESSKDMSGFATNPQIIRMMWSTTHDWNVTRLFTKTGVQETYYLTIVDPATVTTFPQYAAQDKLLTSYLTNMVNGVNVSASITCIKAHYQTFYIAGTIWVPYKTDKVMVPMIHTSTATGTMDPLSHQIMPPEMFLKDTEFFSLVIDKLEGRQSQEQTKRERMYGIASYRSQDGKQLVSGSFVLFYWDDQNNRKIQAQRISTSESGYKRIVQPFIFSNELEGNDSFFVFREYIFPDSMSTLPVIESTFDKIQLSKYSNNTYEKLTPLRYGPSLVSQANQEPTNEGDSATQTTFTYDGQPSPYGQFTIEKDLFGKTNLQQNDVVLAADMMTTATQPMFIAIKTNTGFKVVYEDLDVKSQSSQIRIYYNTVNSDTAVSFKIGPLSLLTIGKRNSDIILADCSTVQHTATPQPHSKFNDNSNYLAMVIPQPGLNQTGAQAFLDMTPHVSFTCTAEECSKCPLFVEWKYQYKYNSTTVEEQLSEYTTSSTLKKVAYPPFVNQIVKQGKFLPVVIDKPFYNDRVLAISPFARIYTKAGTMKVEIRATYQLLVNVGWVPIFTASQELAGIKKLKQLQIFKAPFADGMSTEKGKNCFFLKIYSSGYEFYLGNVEAFTSANSLLPPISCPSQKWTNQSAVYNSSTPIRWIVNQKDLASKTNSAVLDVTRYIQINGDPAVMVPTVMYINDSLQTNHGSKFEIVSQYNGKEGIFIKTNSIIQAFDRIERINFRIYFTNVVNISSAIFTKDNITAINDGMGLMEGTYPKAEVEVNLTYAFCTNQQFTKQNNTDLDFNVSYKSTPTEVLSADLLRSIFTLKYPEWCNDIKLTVLTGGYGTIATTNPIYQVLDLQMRDKDNYLGIKVDSSQAPSNYSNPQQIEISVKIEIQNENSSPFAYSMPINLWLTTFDCSNKTISASTPNMTLAYAPAKSDQQIALDGNFTSNEQTRCPVVRYLIKMNNSIKGTAPTSTQTSVFSMLTKPLGTLNIDTQTPGEYTFYVLAANIVDNFGSIRIDLSISHCLPGTNTIAAPSTMQTSINLTSYTDEQLKDTAKEVQFPQFTNNKEAFCQLTYNLSSNGTQLTPYTEINQTALTLVSNVLKVMVPLDKTQAKSYTFYIVATNPKGVQAFSSMITINTQIACRSLLASVSADNKVSKELGPLVLNASDFGQVNVANTTVLQDFFKAIGLATLTNINCPVQTLSVSVNGTNQQGQNNKVIITPNINLIINQTALASTYLSVAQSATGFEPLTINLTLTDASNSSLALQITVAACGSSWNNNTKCQAAGENSTTNQTNNTLIPEEEPIKNKLPELTTTLPAEGIEIPDRYSIFVENPASKDLLTSFNIGTVSDGDNDEVTVTSVIAPTLSHFLMLDMKNGLISLTVDQAALYSKGPLKLELSTQFTLTLDDTKDIVEITIPVKILTDYVATKNETEPVVEEKVEQVEEEIVVDIGNETITEEEEKPEEEVEDESLKIPEFKFTFTERQIVAENKPVESAPDGIPPTEIKKPQISSIRMSETGLATLTFSKLMMYPKNWVSKYMADNGLSDVDPSLVDKISVPLIRFYYEVAGQESPQLQHEIPFSDTKILQIMPNQIMFNISFKSLDNPDSISLTHPTLQDLLIVQIPKALILNDQEGNSLVLDPKSFEEEDSQAFYMSVSLEPQQIKPVETTSKGIQGAASSQSSVTSAATAAGLAGSILSGSAPEDLASNLHSEQLSATESAMKQIQSGNVNGYNKQMSKAAGCDYQSMDFLSARNMTWTSQPPEGDGLKRMGVETKNFPKNIGSTVMGGVGGLAVAQSIGPIASGIGAMFEGGEKSLHEQVKGLRKKYQNSLSSPIKPTINAVIGLVYIKIVTGGIVNTQNSHLLEAKNFGPNGTLSVGDQVSIVFGYFGLVAAFVLFIMMSVNIVVEIPWMFNFGKMVVGTEYILKRQSNHKWFLFSMGQLKTFIWVYIIIFLVDDNFAVPQMILAIIINPWNLHVMWKLKPLPKALCIDLNLVDLGIGLAATLTIYFKLGTSDVNKMVTPEAKIFIGWVVLITGQLKVYLGHLKLGGMQYLQHKSKVDFVKHIFMKCFCMKKGKQIKLQDKSSTMTLARRALIDEYQLKYKSKFYKLDKQLFHPSNFGKVAPIEAFRPPKAKRAANFTLEEVRQKKLKATRKILSRQKDSMADRIGELEMPRISEENFYKTDDSELDSVDGWEDWRMPMDRRTLSMQR